jgi:hypothetical protein
MRLRGPPPGVDNYSSMTLSLPLMGTHMCVPSKAIPTPVLVSKPPMVAPVGDSSLRLLMLFRTHMFAPSKAIPPGFDPTWKGPIFAPVGS